MTHLSDSLNIQVKLFEKTRMYYNDAMFEFNDFNTDVRQNIEQ